MGHLSVPGTDTGSFSTDEISGGEGKGKKTSRTIALPNGQYKSPPVVRSGLNAFNADAVPGDNLRLCASVENVTPNSMDVVAETWSNSTLSDATINWIEHKEDAKDVLTGSWEVNMVAKNAGGKNASNRVSFSTPFDEPPVIVLWLHYLDLRSNSHQWRIHTFATDVTRDAFTVNIVSWAGSQIYKGGVTWIAYKRDKLDIDSGQFAADSQRSQRQGQKTRDISFRSGKFVAPPTVLSAFSMIDHTTLEPLTIASVARNVSAKGFTWTLETESEWTCSAVYIAIGQTPLAKGNESTGVTATQVEIKDDKEIHAHRDDWIVNRAQSLELLRTSLSEWEDNLKKREVAIDEVNAQRIAAIETRETAAKEPESAIEQREEVIKQRKPVSGVREDTIGAGNYEDSIRQLQEEVERLKLQLVDAASKRAPMRPSRAVTDPARVEDIVDSASPRPPIQPPTRELPAGNLNWGFDPDLLARFNQGMAGRNLMRPSRREREEGSAW